MEQEPQGDNAAWATTKALGGLAVSSLILAGGGEASVELFSRGTAEGNVGGMLMLAFSALGAYGVSVEWRHIQELWSSRSAR
jgi:hypothetical protein